MNFTHLKALFHARNLEFFRDRAALSWNILLPVFILAGFAFAFSGDPAPQYKVAVYFETSQNKTAGMQHLQQHYQQKQGFFSLKYIQFVTVDDLPASIEKIKQHQFDMLMQPDRQYYWINQESPSGYLLEHLLHSSMLQATLDWNKQTVSGNPIRYIDWLIPGVLGMNMMFSALFGVGYVVVRYRKNGVLKRLKATPLTPLEFLTAQILSRLWLIMLVTCVIFIGAKFFINFTMNGSYLNLFLVFMLGTFSIISLSLIIASRLTSEEFASGLLNLLSWPMMFLSGVWFSLDGLHPAMKTIAALFPLTHVINASRAIMIDGAGLLDIATPILTLLLMSIVFLLIGARWFKWE